MLCSSTNLKGITESWPGGISGLSMEPAPTCFRLHLHRTKSPSSHCQCYKELVQMLPLHKLAFTPYINFMAGVLLLPDWCSALYFIPRGMNGSGFNLPNGGKLTSQKQQNDTCKGRRRQFCTACFPTLFALIFLGIQNER